VPDLWLTGDHSVGKLSAMGRFYMPHTREMYGCWLQAKVRERGLWLLYRLHAGAVCDTQRRCSCGMRLVALLLCLCICQYKLPLLNFYLSVLLFIYFYFFAIFMWYTRNKNQHR